MAKEIIAVDVDDVLAASAEGFANFSNEMWGGSYHPESYSEEWAKFWGVTEEETARRSDVFHASDAVTLYRPFDEAVPVLRALSEKHNLVVVTSRQTRLKPQTDEWIERHFPGVFDGIHYAGIWETEEHVSHQIKQTKATVCANLGAHYLIDDQLKHCAGVSEVGVQALLFGDYGWNQNVMVPAGIEQVLNWAAVEEYFNAKG